MDIMGIERIENEKQYHEVLFEIRKLAESEPASDSEEADIINHLFTLVTEWYATNEPKEIKTKSTIVENHIKKSIDKPSLACIIYTRVRDLVT